MILLRYSNAGIDNAGIDNTVFEGTCTSCGAVFGATESEHSPSVVQNCTCCGAKGAVDLARKHASPRISRRPRCPTLEADGPDIEDQPNDVADDEGA